MSIARCAGTLVLLALACSLWRDVVGHVTSPIMDRHIRIMRSTFATGGAIEFFKQPQAPETPVMDGHPVTMRCDTSSSAIHWTFNGEKIANSSRRYFTLTGWSSTLTITRAMKTVDSGKFGCVVTLPSGQEVKSEETLLDITWLEHPYVELESPENEKSIVEGVEVHLLCEADIGNGDVQYHWFRNSERVSSKMQRIDLKKKNLHIKQVSSKDNGVYRCSIHLNGETKESKKHFILNIKDDKLPQISVPPTDLLLPPKSHAHFDCVYQHADILEWFKDDSNSPLETNTRFIIHKNGSLTIKNVTRRDEGFYSCVAYRNNEKTQLQRYSAKLKIAYLKSIIITDFEPQLYENRIVIAQEGQEFSLSCLSSKDNYPQSQITWKNPAGHLISDSGDTRVDDEMLIISNVKKSHQGIYTCTSENIAGLQEFTLFLVVNPTPKIIKNPMKITVDENQTSFLKCDLAMEKQKNLITDIRGFWNKIVTLSYLKTVNKKPHHSKKHNGERGFPMLIGNFTTLGEFDPNEKDNDEIVHLNKDQLIEKWLNDFNWDLYELKWKKDSGKTVRPDSDHITITPREGILKFEQTTISDKGNYWCEVITSAGMLLKSETASVIITEKLKFSPPPVNKKLELYSSAKIHCKVQGTPTPTVTWYRDFNDSLPDDVQSINGTIQFSQVSRGHKGNYTCVAKNSQGSIHTFIFIDVVVSPRFISPTPNQTIDVSEGEPVWIDCIAEGDPEPKTQWDRNRNIIATVNSDNETISNGGDAINRGSGINENERIHLLDNGTLYIKSTRIEDGDIYGCTAGNSAGLRRAEVSLEVHAPGDVIGDQEENEDGVITKAILITMSVVGAYMLLVIGLMVWCRLRRKRKLARNLANEKLENGELELKEKDGPNDKLIENNDDIVNADSDKYCQLKNAKNKCNGSGNLKAKNGNIVGKSRGSNDNCGNTTGGESGPNMSDNSEVSANSKASRKGFSGGNSRYDKISMPRTLLYDFISLGRGEFGDVMLAKYNNSKTNQNVAIEEVELLNGDTTTLTDAEEVDRNCEKEKESQSKFVMVKSLLHTKDENHLAEFKRELDMFSKLKHNNITEVIGLCNEIEPHYLVFEYTDWGDLKQFLLATRTEEEILLHKELDKTAHKIDENSKINKSSSTTPLLVPQILALAHQISKGMEYISDNRMVHKDLATRNCLISSKFTVKISMPALTKDTYSKEYFKHVNQVIPLRWLPHECVFESDYTSKSDVYMFACTIWEIFFKAELPFIKMSDSTVLSQLKNNSLTWKAHSNMQPNLVELLEKCWDVSLKTRPTFTEITRQIARMLKESTISK